MRFCELVFESAMNQPSSCRGVYVFLLIADIERSSLKADFGLFVIVLGNVFGNVGQVLLTQVEFGGIDFVAFVLCKTQGLCYLQRNERPTLVLSGSPQAKVSI